MGRKGLVGFIPISGISLRKLQARYSSSYNRALPTTQKAAYFYFTWL